MSCGCAVRSLCRARVEGIGGRASGRARAAHLLLLLDPLLGDATGIHHVDLRMPARGLGCNSHPEPNPDPNPSVNPNPNPNPNLNPNSNPNPNPNPDLNPNPNPNPNANPNPNPEEHTVGQAAICIAMAFASSCAREAEGQVGCWLCGSWSGLGRGCARAPGSPGSSRRSPSRSSPRPSHPASRLHGAVGSVSRTQDTPQGAVGSVSRTARVGRFEEGSVPVWMYVSMMPSLADLPAFLSTAARPLARRASTATSALPSASTSAFLQSIMPAPV